MNTYTQTNIWKRTLGDNSPDSTTANKEYLEKIKVEFEASRDKAQTLASEISISFPHYTDHSITHIDALWDTADLVVPHDLPLNPAEIFILGEAFLIHDLGMGLAAYPEGINKLKEEPLWKDSVAAILKTKFNCPIKDKDIENVDQATENIVIEKILRLQHAKHAEELVKKSWKNNKGEDIFLINDPKLRESYSDLIGRIAHSHWWPVEELENNLPKDFLGAPEFFPKEWTVDAIKVACILRIADAIQIDGRRAPSFLRSIRKPKGISELHWNFQEHLLQPTIKDNRLVFTTKYPFKVNESESWWLCHDTLQMIDHELRKVDSLLVRTKKRLNVIGVASIDDPQQLSQLIQVDNWRPIDTKIKVSNVAKLVHNLGGKQLYGNNYIVPLREVIQNASDAIRARRLLENEPSNFGDITIRFNADEHGDFIEIEDNGIGMSQKVLTGPFLDFGESFWGTDLMHEELPGLESKGFKSTGKYGIGFFSVFMWGEKVSITSKRFEEGRDSSLVLEFNKGVSSRPILRSANKTEIIKDGGTRIRIWFSSPSIKKQLLEYQHKQISTTELITKLCPSLDCNVYLEEGGEKKQLIQANDWINMSPIDLIKRIMGDSIFKSLKKDEQDNLFKLSNNMNILKEKDGSIVGRLLLYPSNKLRSRFSGTVTIGGLYSSELSYLLGILIGRSDRASRDVGIPIVSNEILKDWSEHQATLLESCNLDSETEINTASIIKVCGGNTKNLKIAYNKNGIVNYNELVNYIKSTEHKQYYIVQDANVFCYERKNSCKINFYENVIWVEMCAPGILQTKNFYSYISWPSLEISTSDDYFLPSLEHTVMQAFSEAWEKNINEIDSISDFSSDEKNFSGIIGTVDKREVQLDHLNIIRKPE